ncbi:inhibitor of growth protein 3 [Ditylenchus destructor]|uniref:Inhibitor of growth protein 3 n=1 Tax=Ditylenchus destructor TaxID=166010 RepID=A0AAD4MUB0_9BILA|nr:inhibitor of growth protein 3 [Ditylenchus destructor]
MHYLEDDIELLEGVPTELKQQCCEMRDLDFRVEKALSDVREESREFFNVMNTLPRDERESRIARIRRSYQQIRELSEDKIAVAEYLHLMLEKYQERISRDLSEFKYELELDTPGVTDNIEKELNESIQSAINARQSRFSEYDGVPDDSGYSDDIKSPSASRMNGHRHAGNSSDAQQVPGGSSSSVDENFNSAPSGSRPQQIQRRGTQASVDEATNSVNEYFSGPPKKKVSKLNATLPNFRVQQPQAVSLDAQFGIRKSSGAGGPSSSNRSASRSTFGTTHVAGRVSASQRQSVGGESENPPAPEDRHPQTEVPRDPPLGPHTWPEESLLASGSPWAGLGDDKRPPSSLGNSPPESITGSPSPSAHLTPTSGAPSIMNPFTAGHEQSQFGRPVKLTSRVAQMLKDRQSSHHRVSRPSGAVAAFMAQSGRAPSTSSYAYGQGRYQPPSSIGMLKEDT